MRWISYLFVFVFLGLATGGCARPFRPPPPVVTPQTQPDARVNLADYLGAARAGRWVYRRTDAEQGAEAPTLVYARKISPSRLAEGKLEARDLRPIAQYLQSEEQATEHGAPGSEAPLRDGAGILFRLGEPVAAIPEDLEAGRPNVARTEIVYYDRMGRPGGHGELTRTAEIEGTETVTCSAGEFPDCLRVRVTLDVRFRWGPTIELTSYMWLSKTAGEVKRLQSMSGWFLIFYFSSSFAYELAAFESAPVEEKLEPAPRWSGGALLFRRTVPRPDIAGMVVDFEPPAP